jgi:hypothetical protein
MKTEELAELLCEEYGITSPVRNKNQKTRIGSRTLRNWAGQGLISRTWHRDGKRGRPRSEFPKRAIAEAATLWAIKKTKFIRGYPPTKEEFSRFLDQVGLVYSSHYTGARLALHDIETTKGFVSLFVPFDDATVNASPVLDKLLVARVVIVLEKAKRGWPLKQEARVIFTWRLDSVPQTHLIMGEEVIGIKPTFTRKRIHLEDADQNQLIYTLLPCDWWPFGKTMLTIINGDITIAHPHPILELLEPSDKQKL